MAGNKLGLLLVLFAGLAFAEPEQKQAPPPAELLMPQQQVAPPPPTGTQLRQRLSENCVAKLVYYKRMRILHPDSWYYKYLLGKWEKRCLD